MRVLIIEDDHRLAELIQQTLHAEGYRADVANDGDLGHELLMQGTYEVAIIDWMLPGRDGPSLCRSARSAGLGSALLLLTARAQVEDRVAGLDSGADDYLVKPFAMDELLARVRALARRNDGGQRDPLELRHGQIVMDLRAHSTRRGRQSLDLTKTEWALLEFLLRHPGQTLNRQQILDYVWSYEREVQPSMVDVYISYLRKKLDQPGLPDPIETVRGVGYRLKDNHAD